MPDFCQTIGINIKTGDELDMQSPVVLILGHGHKYGAIRCLPERAKGLDIDLSKAIMIDNEPYAEPD